MYEVEEELLAKADKCAYQRNCLSQSQEKMCKPQFLLANDTMFVQKKDGADCQYYLTYGFSGICRCPVRKFLYKRYGI
jgi:hypothetical protein